MQFNGYQEGVVECSLNGHELSIDEIVCIMLTFTRKGQRDDGAIG